MGERRRVDYYFDCDTFATSYLLVCFDEKLFVPPQEFMTHCIGFCLRPREKMLVKE